MYQQVFAFALIHFCHHNLNSELLIRIRAHNVRHYYRVRGRYPIEATINGSSWLAKSILVLSAHRENIQSKTSHGIKAA